LENQGINGRIILKWMKAIYDREGVDWIHVVQDKDSW
jgi:hypothetical protein